MRYSFSVSKIPEGKSTLSWPLDERLFETIGANYEIEALKGDLQVHIQRDSQFLRIEIVLTGEAIVACDLCLQSILLPFSAKHQQVYALTARYTHPEEAEEFYVLGPREDRIDLTQAVYDYVCLALPIKRVRPTCPDDTCPPYVKAFIRRDAPDI